MKGSIHGTKGIRLPEKLSRLRQKLYLKAKREPSKNSLRRQRNTIREITGPRKCYKPVQKLIEELNEQVHGWGNYFRFGYPRKAFRSMNWYVCERLKRHLRRRS
jgi:hypothetical protein